MDVGSAAALYAGSVLVKKTFEVVAQRSLSSLFTRLHVRFRGQIETQLQELQKELESRLQVLSLPVDMCVQYVLHGNTALQGALDMALRVINDIVSFQEELEAQTYNESIVKTSQADAVARLQSFMTRLDSILPYLSMAVNAVSLLRVADSGLSPSRLMESSHLVLGIAARFSSSVSRIKIRTANSREGAVISLRAKVYKYETKLTLPQWQEKMMQCCVTLRQASTMPGLGSNEFELSITNEEESEAEDLSSCICLPVSDITAVGSSTLHVLGLGQHELEAVLLVDILVSFSTSHTQEVSKDGSVSTSNQEVNYYAFQCIEDDDDDDDDPENGVNQQDGTSDNEGDAQELVSSFGSKVYKLGMLEYALRLCMLQAKEEKEHWLLSDERIRLFFVDPRYISEPVSTVQKTRSGSGKMPSSFRTPTPGKGAPIRHSRTSVGVSKVASRIPSSRSNISELFYDLRLESPGGSGAS